MLVNVNKGRGNLFVACVSFLFGRLKVEDYFFSTFDSEFGVILTHLDQLNISLSQEEFIVRKNRVIAATDLPHNQFYFQNTKDLVGYFDYFIFGRAQFWSVIFKIRRNLLWWISANIFRRYNDIFISSLCRMVLRLCGYRKLFYMCISWSQKNELYFLLFSLPLIWMNCSSGLLYFEKNQFAILFLSLGLSLNSQILYVRSKFSLAIKFWFRLEAQSLWQNWTTNKMWCKLIQK